MKYIWPRSLAGQLTAVLLIILIAAQAVVLIILHDERRLALMFAARQEVLSRIVAVVKLMEEAPPGLHKAILASASTPGARFHLSDTPVVAAHGESGLRADDDDDDHDSDEDTLGRILAGRLGTLLGAGQRDVRVSVIEGDDDDQSILRGWREGRPIARMFGGPHADARNMHQRMRPQDMHAARMGGVAVSLRINNGRWLNAATRVPPPDMAIAVSSVIAMGAAGLILILIAVLMVRRVTRPMARLAEAAERLGRGEAVTALPEDGPSDIQGTTRAFNAMTERLERFVSDRARMLAAITHDLRTPITSLRLRAEMVDDEEARTRMLETLEEMQELTEAALDYAREDAVREDTRSVDISALIDSLCDDLQNMGLDISFYEAERLVVRCRPAALRRAIRNVAENAIRYGNRAILSLAENAQRISVYVDDFGPGIPEAEREKIFEPFVRLESSRSKETGGIGLGLAIARSVLRGHGGDIEIEDRREGGARFTLWLPKSGD
ncbi:MAG: HAMP domain-containing protein [Rhodospirillaceae bacterium]|jgi:signal transduction histidine kinase|nr:HAMP domain-containing protein [Rhodospirillaceae bacterium]MBT4117304.1 HAMP domain-containing protein [Rhodospirillaceae bacterium]MBT4670702.1 HAMP domain-containing protein [Rhodospirillaceae bacterium]MBT4720352.1 HAMP domain-containing protein [Rhodospirillaceae bacterium]MBT4748782.1 HAMP domain-containing protein [Rhodospirillaceae bacterium]